MLLRPAHQVPGAASIPEPVPTCGSSGRNALDPLEDWRLIDRPLRGGHRDGYRVLVAERVLDLIAGPNVVIRLRHHVVGAHDDFEVPDLAHESKSGGQHDTHHPEAVPDHQVYPREWEHRAAPPRIAYPCAVG